MRYSRSSAKRPPQREVKAAIRAEYVTAPPPHTSGKFGSAKRDEVEVPFLGKEPVRLGKGLDPIKRAKLFWEIPLGGPV